MYALALSSDPTTTLELGRALASTSGVSRVAVHVAAGAEPGPFAAVLRAETDTPDRLRPVADVGLYAVDGRHLKQRPVEWPLGTPSPGVVVVYGTRRAKGMTHIEYDEHWNLVHGPLAVRHHAGMCDYWQCALDQPLEPSSRDYDGVAIVAFPSTWSMEHEFYRDAQARVEIGRDAASFTDLERLDRMLMIEHLLSE